MGNEPEARSEGIGEMAVDCNADAAAAHHVAMARGGDCHSVGEAVVCHVAEASKCKGRANNDGRDLGRRWSW